MNPTITKKLVLTALASMALCTVATAQQTPDSGTIPIAGEITLGVSVAQTAVIATGWRASKLVHAPVYNDRDQRIGRVDDFIVAPDGSVSVAIVDVGGFLGLDGHRVAIPVQQFDQISPRIVLSGATKDVLLKMPEFKYAA